MPLPEPERFDVRRAEERVRSALGDDACAAARAEGRAQGEDELSG